MRRVGALAVLLSSAALAGQPVVGAADEAARSDKKVWADTALGGRNRQPRWSERRAFPGPLVYVAPPGAISADFTVEAMVPSGGAESRARTDYQLSIGLPFRFQVDLGLRLEHRSRAPVTLESERIAIRWAPANWEVLPWNPTLYLQWIRPTVGPQKIEARLLLGGPISDRWYWGGHFFWERELWGTSLTNVYGLTGSVSAFVSERSLSFGGGYRIEVVDIRDERFKARTLTFILGPTMSLQPLEGLQLLLGLFCGPLFQRDDVTGPFTAKFLFQPTLVGGWRF